MNIRLFRNNLPRIVLRPFYFSFFFQFFFLFKVLFVFFFLVTITAPRWTVERREEKEIATKMIECLFFSFFRLLMAFDFLPCNFTLEAVSFGSMLIQHYEHLQIAIEIFFSSWVMFHGYVYDMMNYWRQLEEINWKCSILLSILWKLLKIIQNAMNRFHEFHPSNNSIYSSSIP